MVADKTLSTFVRDGDSAAVRDDDASIPDTPIFDNEPVNDLEESSSSDCRS